MSERRAYTTIDCVRMTVRYRSRRPDDTELRQRLRALAERWSLDFVAASF
jgi:putative transposase